LWFQIASAPAAAGSLSRIGNGMPSATLATPSPAPTSSPVVAFLMLAS